jgi:hypothetical protein
MPARLAIMRAAHVMPFLILCVEGPTACRNKILGLTIFAAYTFHTSQGHEEACRLPYRHDRRPSEA